MNGEIEAGGWRPIRLDRPPFAERAPIVLSWTVTEGGWIPTHKAACLINGNSGGVVLRSTVEFATSGDNHAWPAARDRDSNRVSGGVQPATLVDGAAHSTRVMNPRTHIGGWATEFGVRRYRASPSKRSCERRCGSVRRLGRVFTCYHGRPHTRVHELRDNAVPGRGEFGVASDNSTSVLLRLEIKSGA